MSNSKLLTPHELSVFVQKLKYTMEAAARAEQLTASLSRLFSGTSAFASAEPSRRGSLLATNSRTRQPKLDPAKVLSAVLNAKKGVAVGELATLLNQSVPRIRVALVSLRSDGKLQMKGTKRNALWFAAKPD